MTHIPSYRQRHQHARATHEAAPHWPELLIVALAIVSTVLVTGSTSEVWTVAAPLLLVLGIGSSVPPRG